MKQNEKQIILDAFHENQKVMLYYYEQGKKTGEWQEHKEACSVVRAIREIMESLGISDENTNH